MNLQEQKNNFFELGRAICRFVVKISDEYEQVIVHKIASSLELEVPDIDELFKELTSSGSSLTKKWFSGSRSQFENYYDLGQFAEGFFLNYLFNIHTAPTDSGRYDYSESNERSTKRLLSLVRRSRYSNVSPKMPIRFSIGSADIAQGFTNYYSGHGG